MARPVWKGALSFGLVSVPVRAYTAVRDHSVHFHQLVKGTGARVRYEKVAEDTHEELEADDIELGYELPGGAYVTFARKELDALQPASSRTLEVSDFVELAAIDPIYYERTYWLAPDGDAAAHAYRLLLAAMEAEQRVGVGTVVMRNKQYLAAVRPLDGALAMSTMRFADEVVPRSDIEGLPTGRAKPAAKELALAKQILDALAADWDPARYHDSYTEELRAIIERKADGETVEPEAAPARGEQVLDLMAALEASLARGRTGSTTTSKATKSTKATKEKAAPSRARATKAGKASKATKAAKKGSAKPAARATRKSA